MHRRVTRSTQKFLTGIRLHAETADQRDENRHARGGGDEVLTVMPSICVRWEASSRLHSPASFVFVTKRPPC